MPINAIDGQMETHTGNDTVTIRTAGPSDLDRIMELEHSSFGEEAFDRDLYRALLERQRCLILLAEQPGSLLGMIVITWRLGSARVRIYSLAVAAAYRRRGVARALLGEAARVAEGLRKTSLVLEVRQANSAAVGLYESAGYRKTRTLPHYYGPGKHGQEMILTLPEPAPRATTGG